MDSSAQWMMQEFGTANVGMAAETGGAPKPMERKVRPQKDQALNCPRCHSTNTKFCYYNNYSLTQPRYFCKTCRRYWTQGGTLRNVPVGGGSRKNKKSTSASRPSPIPPHHRLPDLNPPFISQFPATQNPKLHEQGQDLNLGLIQGAHDYHQQHGIPHFLELPKIENRVSISSSANSATTALNTFSNGIAAGGLINSFMPMVPNANAFIAFPFQDCKAGTGFSSDGSRYGNSYHVTQDESNVNGSLMFTFAPNRRNSGTDAQGDADQSKPENNNSSNGFGNGMLGGGFW